MKQATAEIVPDYTGDAQLDDVIHHAFLLGLRAGTGRETAETKAALRRATDRFHDESKEEKTTCH